MTAQSSTLVGRASLLRRTLQLDGAGCVVGGVGLAAGAAALAPLTGLPAQLLLAVGAALIPYGALLLWAAARPELDRRIAWGAIVVDDLWIVGSAALLLGAAPLTPLGWWLVLDLAIVVGLVGIATFLGLRRDR